MGSRLGAQLQQNEKRPTCLGGLLAPLSQQRRKESEPVWMSVLPEREIRQGA